MSKISKLAILDQIDIPNPCHEDWSKMSGDDKRRHCLSCDHSVINLSEYTRREATSLLASNTGRKLCVRYLSSPNGTPRYKESISLFSKLAACIAALCSIFPIGSSVYADGDKASEIPPIEIERTLMGDIMQVPTPTPTPQATKPSETMGAVALPEGKQTVNEENIRMGKMAPAKCLHE